MEGHRRRFEPGRETMKNPRENTRIFWLVRLLAAAGLATIMVLIGLVGRQISSIHTERVKLQKEQEQLYKESEEILRRSGEARGEIIAILEGDPAAGDSGATKGLEEMIDRLIATKDHSFTPDMLKQLDDLTDSLSAVEVRALAWRAQYDTVLQDLREQRTMGQVRNMIAGLRGAVETLEGKQRLHDAIQLKRWRAANGADAASLALAILADQDRRRNQGTGDLERELAEMESLVELLRGEEHPDNLPNLKDNLLTPALERLRHDLDQFVASQPESDFLTGQVVVRLTAGIFGQGYTKDQTRQTISPGAGGLYLLRQDTLLLRSEHGKLDRERSTLSHDIDTVVGAILQTAGVQSGLLAEQVEQNLDSSWRRMMITGFGCSGLFLWLAWLISRAIQGQVGVIAESKADAESGRQTAQLLMQDLRKLQRDHKLVLNSIGEGIHWIDCKGQIIFENPASNRLLGWENSEMLGRSAHATMHHTRADGSKYPQSECPIYASLRTGVSQRVDHEVFWRKDGTSFPVEYTTTPVREESGKIIGAVVVFSDITERRRDEKRLRESEERFQLVSRATDDAIWDWDVVGNEISYSESFGTLFGYKTGEFESTMDFWTKGIHPDDRDPLMANRHSFFAGHEEAWSGEYRFRCADGSYAFVYDRGYVVRDAAGKPLRMVGSMMNVTERRQLEQELKEAKVTAAMREGAQRYSFLADAMPQIIFTARPDGRGQYVNKAWFAYTGLTLAQTADWGWGKLVHPDDLRPCFEQWRHSFTTGENLEIEFRFKRASDGAYRWHLGRAQPRRDERGQIVQWMGSCMDIDDAKRSKEILQAANDELGLRVLERTSELHAAKEAAEAANRAKSDFLANMSHEIRTPMNGVIGMTELVLESALTPQQRDYLNMANESGHALLALINDILDFSKIEAGKLELEAIPFSLRGCIGEIFKPLAVRARTKGLDLRTEVADDVPEHLIGDPLRLRQILLNFADNALKFTERGSIVVKVTAEAAIDGEQCLHFAVTDTGIGIPLEKQKVIFEAFSQADGSTTRTYGGTGLGLAIASQLVEQMRGKIWIESAKGKGTTFHFTAWFDVADAADVSSSSPDSASPKMVISSTGAGDAGIVATVGMRILLAEDNVINRALATGILAKRGHSLVQAANGREAVAAAAQEAFDLILMDVQMPDMDGFEATDRIRKAELGTDHRSPIVAMTAHAMAGDRERCLAAGMDDYLSKPLIKSDLLALLDRFSAGRNPAIVMGSSRVPEAARPLNAVPISRRESSNVESSIFSRARLLDDLDDDEALMRQVIMLFHQNTPRLLSDIREALASGEALDMSRSAHALLSSLGAVGATCAHDLAHHLEELGQQGDLADAGATFAELERETGRVAAALDELICPLV
jgi:PAS domain S-box-containing protein